MKHIFVVNPSAGRRSSVGVIRDAIAAYPEQDCLVIETRAPRDAIRIVDECCETYEGLLRFYACGGDGTLNEVAEGVLRHSDRASLSCYPCGSGNDFVKYYGGASVFLSDFKALLEAEERPIDLMKVNDRVSINITNFGFDTEVAKTMIAVKKKPVIGGKNAYTTGVLKAFFTSMKNRCTVIADGQVMNPNGILLFGTVACGRYVGGSFCCSPYSDNTDGLLDVCVSRPIPRLRLLRLIKYYKAGTHLEEPACEGIFTTARARRVELLADPGFALTLDGEIVEGTRFDIEVLPAAIRFAVPVTKTEGTKI